MSRSQKMHLRGDDPKQRELDRYEQDMQKPVINWTPIVIALSVTITIVILVVLVFMAV